MNIPTISNKDIANALWVHINTVLDWQRWMYNPKVDKLNKLIKRAERQNMNNKELIDECNKRIAISNKLLSKLK